MQPVDRLVGEVVLEVVALAVLGLGNADHLLVLGDQRVVLPRLAAEEAPEVVEPQPGRPAVERPGEALLVVRGEMPLPEAAGQVAVLLEDPREGRAVARNGRVVAREGAGELADHAEAHPVVVAAGQQRRPGRRAQRRDVEAVVAQAVVREPRVVRRLDRPAEGARVSEPGVVDQDEQDVRCVLRRLDVARLAPVGRGVGECPLRLTAERRAPNRKNRPIDRRLTHALHPSHSLTRIGTRTLRVPDGHRPARPPQRQGSRPESPGMNYLCAGNGFLPPRRPAMRFMAAQLDRGLAPALPRK